ncbi:hypothetical protein HMPREF9138_02410 [Prevotella histicola F0411]|uniref:Uncharacterized protein n=1 Tax=Prevotella histicola F0411 TaxID=857291 RepID=G6AJY3_9BACT|nr:hypothetical protein HMPREF9138_02410 [Prevotella histicola F0411]
MARKVKTHINQEGIDRREVVHFCLTTYNKGIKNSIEINVVISCC